jgi:hypothetical protein
MRVCLILINKSARLSKGQRQFSLFDLRVFWNCIFR